MADAIFDPMSNITLIVANLAVNRVDGRRFPSGKARIGTAGNITFCFIMSAVGAVIIVLSARDLVSGSEDSKTTFHLPSIICSSRRLRYQVCALAILLVAQGHFIVRLISCGRTTATTCSSTASTSSHLLVDRPDGRKYSLFPH
jgi:hypothetical protein